MGKVEELDDQTAQEMVAAIRNEDNLNSLILQKVKIDGIETRAICWIRLEDGKTVTSPLAVLVAPSMFDKLEVVFDE